MHRKQPKEITNSIGMRLVLIPAALLGALLVGPDLIVAPSAAGKEAPRQNRSAEGARRAQAPSHAHVPGNGDWLTIPRQNIQENRISMPQGAFRHHSFKKVIPSSWRRLLVDSSNLDRPFFGSLRCQISQP
jgi:hypothetical protein